MEISLHMLGYDRTTVQWYRPSWTALRPSLAFLTLAAAEAQEQVAEISSSLPVREVCI